jgi:hypothetical protein
VSEILPHMFAPLLALRAYARAAGVEWTGELQASLTETYRGRALSDALLDELVAEIEARREDQP